MHTDTYTHTHTHTHTWECTLKRMKGQYLTKINQSQCRMHTDMKWLDLNTFTIKTNRKKISKWNYISFLEKQKMAKYNFRAEWRECYRHTSSPIYKKTTETEYLNIKSLLRLRSRTWNLIAHYCGRHCQTANLDMAK